MQHMRHSYLEEAIINQQLRDNYLRPAGTSAICGWGRSGLAPAGTISRAAVAVLSFPSLQHKSLQSPGVPTFPYVPGFLSFREIPANRRPRKD